MLFYIPSLLQYTKNLLIKRFFAVTLTKSFFPEAFLTVRFFISCNLHRPRCNIKFCPNTAIFLEKNFALWYNDIEYYQAFRLFAPSLSDGKNHAVCLC